MTDHLETWQHIDSLKEENQQLRTENERLKAKVESYEIELSECIAPETITGEQWTENLPDGNHILLMRGSPRLAQFIAYLHQSTANTQKENAELRTELNRLKGEMVELARISAQKIHTRSTKGPTDAK